MAIRIDKATIHTVLDNMAPHGDGRHKRSHSSRGKIILAMIDLIAAGELNPRAANIAEKAGVGLRSVFRHFDDKETIFREINAVLIESYRPLLRAPLMAETWQGQLVELMIRRADIFEATTPFRLATSVQRFHSPVLMQNYRNLMTYEKRAVRDILPPAVKADKTLTRAILLVTSFDSWRFFRHDEDLSHAQSVRVIEKILCELIVHIK